jgi:hypothetical protein
MKFDATTLVALKRTEIQRLAKEYGIKANQKVNMREPCFFFSRDFAHLRVLLEVLQNHDTITNTPATADF